MKKLLLFLTLAMAAMVTPHAQAHSKDPWRYPYDQLQGLYPRLQVIDEKRARWGASPHLDAEIATLHAGTQQVADAVKNHHGDDDPRPTQNHASDLYKLADQVDAEFQNHIDRIRANHWEHDHPW